MWEQNIIFYTVASTVIAVIAQAAGASLAVILFVSLLAPPVLLLIIRIIRYQFEGVKTANVPCSP